MKKLSIALILGAILTLNSCGHNSGREGKELLEKILRVVGIPHEVILNICQTDIGNDMCENFSISNKREVSQKVTKTKEGQYILQTTNPCKPILLQLQDGDVKYDNGEFFLKFSGVEYGMEEKEVSILEAMQDANYLTSDSTIYIKHLKLPEAQDKFYSTLYRSLKWNLNVLRAKGLDQTQSIRGALREMATELLDFGLIKPLPDRINECNSSSCIDKIMGELCVRLKIGESESELIFEMERENSSPLTVKEVSCVGTIDLKQGLIAHYKFENNGNDSSNNGNGGEILGGVNFVDGVDGKGASFDGVDDYIYVKLNSQLKFNPNIHSFSLSGWMKPEIFLDNDGGCTYTAIPMIETYRYSITNREIEVKRDDSYEGQGGAKIKEALWDTQKWHLFSGTWTVFNNRAIAKYYVDGVLRDVKEYKVIPNGIYTWDGLYIGRTRHCSYSYNYGKFLADEIRIYDRVLNDLEIAEIYKTRK